jgi:ADP-heptose:LPS heptosyltransferase
MPSSAHNLPCSIVYHAGALGDFITTFPCIFEWNKQHPRLNKILFGKPAYGILGIQNDLFDEIVDIESRDCSWLYEFPSKRPGWFQERYSNIKAAIAFSSPSSPVSRNFTSLGINNLIIQDPFPQTQQHIVSYHLSALKKTANEASIWPRCSPHPDYVTEAQQYIGNRESFIVIHPGSGSKNKNWPYQNYLTLTNQLQNLGHQVFWILGEADSQIPDPLVCPAIKHCSLSALVHIFSRCSLYIGNDSGISHLAAASGAKGIVVFGNSDPIVWRPASHLFEVIQPTDLGNSSVNDISIQVVFEKCRVFLD